MSWESSLLRGFNSIVVVTRALSARRHCVLAGLAVALYGCGSVGPVLPETGAEEGPRDATVSAWVRGRARGIVGGEQDPKLQAPAPATQAYDRALAAMSSGDYTEAELELAQLTLQYPDYAGPYVNLAILYRRDGRASEARDALELALALDPGHPAANNQLGMLLRSEGQFGAAEEAYLNAIAADPGYPLAHYNLGVLLDLYLKRPADALEHYEHYQGLAAEPDDRVSRWIIDLRRRLGVRNDTQRTAREGSL